MNLTDAVRVALILNGPLNSSEIVTAIKSAPDVYTDVPKYLLYDWAVDKCVRELNYRDANVNYGWYGTRHSVCEKALASDTAQLLLLAENGEQKAQLCTEDFCFAKVTRNWWPTRWAIVDRACRNGLVVFNGLSPKPNTPRAMWQYYQYGYCRYSLAMPIQLPPVPEPLSPIELAHADLVTEAANIHEALLVSEQQLNNYEQETARLQARLHELDFLQFTQQQTCAEQRAALQRAEVAAAAVSDFIHKTSTVVVPQQAVAPVTNVVPFIPASTPDPKYGNDPLACFDDPNCYIRQEA